MYALAIAWNPRCLHDSALNVLTLDGVVNNAGHQHFAASGDPGAGRPLTDVAGAAWQGSCSLFPSPLQLKHIGATKWDVLSS